MDRLGPTSIPPPLPLTSTPPPTVHDSDNDTMLQCRVTGRYNRSHLSRGLVFYHRQFRDILQGWDMSHISTVLVVSLGWRYHWLIYSMLLWFWDDYHSLLPPAHGEWHRGPAVSSSSLVVFIGFILSYTELYRGLNVRRLLLLWPSHPITAARTPPIPLFYRGKWQRYQTTFFISKL